MAKRHLKRLAAPTSWGILRKKEVFITRPNAGPHKLEHCIPVCELLKRLGYAKTSREAKKAIDNNPVIINGRRIKSPKAQAGLFDEIKITNKIYRIAIDRGGHLVIYESAETQCKPCKIAGKTMVSGSRIQANTDDGRNILLEKGFECKVGDSLVITFPKQSIKEHFRLETGATVYLTGGKHLGDHGTVTALKGKTIAYKNKNGEEYTTLSEYALVIGREKTCIALP